MSNTQCPQCDLAWDLLPGECVCVPALPTLSIQIPVPRTLSTPQLCAPSAHANSEPEFPTPVCEGCDDEDCNGYDCNPWTSASPVCETGDGILLNYTFTHDGCRVEYMVVGDDEVKVFESYGDRAAFRKFPALHHDIPDKFFDLLDDVMTYLDHKAMPVQEAVPVGWASKGMYCELCGLRDCWCPPAPPQKHDYSRLNSCQECGYPACSQECGMQRFEEELQPQNLTTLFEKFNPYIEHCESCGEYCYCDETQDSLFSYGYIPSALFD